jgi:hypothetical protein
MEEGLGGERKRARGFWAKRPLLPPRSRTGEGQPAGRHGARRRSFRPRRRSGRGGKREGRGDPAPALTSSSDGPWMALRGGVVVVRCGGGGGAMGGSASLLARCGAVRRCASPFIGAEGQFRGKNLPGDRGGGSAGGAGFRGEVNCGAIGWNPSCRGRPVVAAAVSDAGWVVARGDGGARS